MRISRGVLQAGIIWGAPYFSIVSCIDPIQDGSREKSFATEACLSDVVDQLDPKLCSHSPELPSVPILDQPPTASETGSACVSPPLEIPESISAISKWGSGDRTYTAHGKDMQEKSYSFEWVVDKDWKIVSGQGTESIVVIVPSHDGSDTIAVAYSNECGLGPMKELQVDGIRSNRISTASGFIEMMQNPEALAMTWSIDINLDLSGFNWIPIGTELSPFTGVIEGNGHTISNLSIHKPDGAGVGLIGFMDDGGESDKAIVRNLQLVNVAINKDVMDADNVGQNAGALVGKAVGGTITNVCAKDIEIRCGSNCGGLMGYSSGIVTRSCATGTVVALNSTAGGLVADHRGVIRESYAAVDVSAGYLGGGLVGLAYPDSGRYSAAEITDSYATGSVIQIGTQTPISFGGLVARADQVSVRSAFATGDVTASTTTADSTGGVGGFVGTMLHGLIDRSFATGAVVGHSNVGGFVGLPTNLSDGFTIVDSQTEAITKTLIRSSWSSSSVNAWHSCGGFVGRNRAWIEKSYSTGAVDCMSQVGGFVGLAFGSNNGSMRSDISDSYSMSAVNARYAQAGSFAGRGDAARFTRVFAVGAVEAGSESDASVHVFDGIQVFAGGAPARLPQLGGFFGSVCCNVTFDKAFWDIVTTGLSMFSDHWEWNSILPAYLPLGKTTAELQNSDTFSGWDFSNVWETEPNSYPTLRHGTWDPNIWKRHENGSMLLKWQEPGLPN
jgi:hypothetical protein